MESKEHEDELDFQAATGRFSLRGRLLLAVLPRLSTTYWIKTKEG
jgi:hypothetical protein